MEAYGQFTNSVPINIYAIADQDSLIDFGTYKNVLSGQIEFITLYDPAEFGLQKVEGAVLTGERHVVIREVVDYFNDKLNPYLNFNQPMKTHDDGFDLVIDCTFCANESLNIDRYEPCLTVILQGPVNTAITIMDGPFPSLYPWDEEHRLSSLTSARYTPLSKLCKTWEEADQIVREVSTPSLDQRAYLMINQMAMYYPAIRDYEIVEYKLSVRAMPRSGSDARLIDVIQFSDQLLRVRAGKIDAIIQAEQEIKQCLRKLNAV